jgi:hypothetical protein
MSVDELIEHMVRDATSSIPVPRTTRLRRSTPVFGTAVIGVQPICNQSPDGDGRRHDTAVLGDPAHPVPHVPVRPQRFMSGNRTGRWCADRLGQLVFQAAA